MKSLKSLILLFSLLAFVYSCQDDDLEFGPVTAPSNLQIQVDIVGADATNPNGDGSGVVNFTAQADNALAYKFVYDNITMQAPTGSASISFAKLGLNTYSVTAVATGTGGASTSQTVLVDVLATYEPPADLLEKLVGDGTKTWRIKAEKPGHFGLGPVAGTTPTEWYGASAFEKDGLGMYDDRFMFNEDGTFVHVTNGDVFGREVLIEELGGSGGEADGADITNYVFNDYSESWFITAPSGIETLNLSGIGFIGYYIGGNHTYEIFDRSIANEFLLRATDGNNQFDWWFIITSED